MVWSQINLGMFITTVKLYTAIPLLLTFDLCLGHKVNICVKYDVCAIPGTANVIQMKLGMDIKYINRMSHIPVCVTKFAFRGR